MIGRRGVLSSKIMMTVVTCNQTQGSLRDEEAIWGGRKCDLAIATGSIGNFGKCARASVPVRTDNISTRSGQCCRRSRQSPDAVKRFALDVFVLRVVRRAPTGDDDRCDRGCGVAAEDGCSSRGRAGNCLVLGRLMRKYFRISSPSVAASGCLQTLQCNDPSLVRASDPYSVPCTRGR
jgi:hypothetical protein